jgi:hypothetical protein
MWPPPAEGGRRPHAEAAASPQGWPPPKPLAIQKVFDILRPSFLNVKRGWARPPCGRALTAAASALWALAAAQKESL